MVGLLRERDGSSTWNCARQVSRDSFYLAPPRVGECCDAIVSVPGASATLLIGDASIDAIATAQKWHPVGDSNPCRQDENLVS